MVELNLASNDLCQKPTFKRSLTTPELTGVFAIANAIPTMGALEKLLMGANGFKGFEAGKALGDAISVNTVLKELDISGGLFSDEECDAAFFKGFSPGLGANGALSSVNMGYNNIGSEGAKVVAEALRVSPTTILANLDMSSNKIDDDKDCLESFVRLTIERPSIVHIDFAQNGIHAEIVTTLCTANGKQQAGESPCHCLCEKLAHT